MMKQVSFFHVLLSLTLWMLVEALPESSQKNNQKTEYSDNPTRNDALQLMGQPDPSACQNTQNSWSQGQSLWGKLQLSTHMALFQNVWNSAQLDSGSTNTIVCRSFSGGVASFKIDFKMNSLANAKNNVKSYSNLGLYGNTQRIGSLKFFRSSWSWNLQSASNDLIADISYDIFVANDGNCQVQDCASMEIMIWLQAIGGALPASLNGKSVSTIEVIGPKEKYQFDVWKGVVSNKPVISLIPSNGKKYTSFQANFADLFVKLGKYGLRKDQYIITIGAGVEVFRGSGTLDTSAYTLQMKT